MNKSKLKSYAPAARREFIQAVTDRAYFYGLSENKNEIQPVEEKGDVAIIGGRAFPIKMAAQRKNLEQRIEREGFAQVMEAIAYTWFNRFLALRYMEIHGYLEHGFRVLSNPNGNTIPEILEQAAHVQLPGLVQKKVVELKLDGNKDAELYRMLLVAQCNDLNTAMPFLFERINDETELLLPDNLLHSDSLIRKLVTEIDEEDWQQVEIIGWLYQFYISEKKDQVIGKVVKPEDIPAATQLFTPNWIVKYMVQNSLGRTWLTTYTNSPLKNKMEYYIEPAEQTDEVKAQLAAITPKELNPETMTLLDPASGSGHILVEAYDIFKEIYLERGYRSRDIPRLILEKNLYGLDIDDRAAQMTGFALLMKARADDRNILRENPPRLNVMAIQGSEGIDAESIAKELLKEKTYSIVEGPTTLFPETITQPVLSTTRKPEVDKNDIKDLLDLFKQGKNFGSLIQIPEEIAGKLKILANLVESNINSSDLFIQKAVNTLFPFVIQATILAGQFYCVVMNPPYMGSGGMNTLLKDYAKLRFPDSKSDLFAMFIERGLELAKETIGYSAMITMPAWLFLSSFEKLRYRLINSHQLDSLLHIGRGIFGIDWGSTAFVIKNTKVSGSISVFFRLHKRLFQHIYYEDIEKIFLYANENKNYKYDFGSYRDAEGINEILKESYEKGDRIYFAIKTDDFKKIPGSPVAYWVSTQFLKLFEVDKTLRDYGINPATGMQTGDNGRFIRCWFEISIEKRQIKWFPLNDGGDVRKWYGNFVSFINWENNGQEIRAHKSSVIRNSQYYFKEGGTWNRISSTFFAVRYMPEGFIFDQAGDAFFSDSQDELYLILGFLNSNISFSVMKIICPTLNATAGNIELFPYPQCNSLFKEAIIKRVKLLIDRSKLDWDFYERSWDFSCLHLLKSQFRQSTLKATYIQLRIHWREMTLEVQQLEEEINRIFIDAYGLNNELTPNISTAEITLTCNPHYRYDDSKSAEELEVLLLSDTMKEIISYAIGCMMGRYSIDQPGLVYAHSGNVGFDHTKYPSFPADDDGIILVIDIDWFEDDAASRFGKFLKVAWSTETLEENLKFVADSLSLKSGEMPMETIRRYFSTQFYKDHLQTYKKRPIYWLFSSGKQRAFECLVYLHRYNESTLSRMRNEYVTPLQGKFSARADYLANEINSATSTSARNKLQKQLDMLKKKQVELAAFDDLLRHYADKRITIDLDDSVKVNYSKFGNLLADVKAVTGSESEKD